MTIDELYELWGSFSPPATHVVLIKETGEKLVVENMVKVLAGYILKEGNYEMFVTSDQLCEILPTALPQTPKDLKTYAQLDTTDPFPRFQGYNSIPTSSIDPNYAGKIITDVEVMQIRELQASQCECGVDTIGFGRHSGWCKKSELDKYLDDVVSSAERED